MRPVSKLSSTFGILLAVVAAGAYGCTPETGEGSVQTGPEAELNESKHLGMTDVTILYPLPITADHVDDLMSPSSEGDRGPLFAREVFEQLSAIDNAPVLGPDGKVQPWSGKLLDPWKPRYANLRVVAVRVDPCFGEVSDQGGSCQNTIRLVAQFVDPTQPARRPDGRVGIHLFYTVNRAEMTAFLQGLLRLRRAAGLPLQKGFINPTAGPNSNVRSGFGVNPTLASEGLRGPYATGLRDHLLSYAGEKNLTAVAFCVQDIGAERPEYSENNATVAESRSRWIFGRFDVRQGTIYPQTGPALAPAGIQISDIDPVSQPGKRPILVVDPPAVTPDSYFGRLNKKRNEVDAPAWEQMSASALAFLDPRRYSPTTSDCVSCHLADQAVDAQRFDTALYAKSGAFSSTTYRLDHTPLSSGPFRMIGWTPSRSGDARPVLTSRVVNDTAVSLEMINTSVLK